MTLELELLAELRAALTEYEIPSEVCEEITGLAVTTCKPDFFLWVFVNHGGRYFSWNRADRQHPVKDVSGAARRIAEQARQAPGLPDGPQHEPVQPSRPRGHSALPRREATAGDV